MDGAGAEASCGEEGGAKVSFAARIKAVPFPVGWVVWCRAAVAKGKLGLKPARILRLYAALKRRSSTSLHASVAGHLLAAEAGLISVALVRHG